MVTITLNDVEAALIIALARKIEKAEEEAANKCNSFIFDKEKMYDFTRLTKDEFLQSYSYLTEAEYDNTKRIMEVI